MTRRPVDVAPWWRKRVPDHASSRAPNLNSSVASAMSATPAAPRTHGSRETAAQRHQPHFFSKLLETSSSWPLAT